MNSLQTAETAARLRCLAPGLSPEQHRNALAEWAEARVMLAHFLTA